MKQQFKNIRSRIIKLANLQSIDEHQSFQFLKRKYDIQPSQIITFAIIIILFLFIIFDGRGIISSLLNFAFPTYCLYTEITKKKHDKNLSRSKNQSHSHMTDQQFSQIVSNKFFSRTEVLEVYLIYFIFYIVTEVVSPIMQLVIGSIAWLILRFLLTILMTKTKQRLMIVSKIISYNQKYINKEQFIVRRNMQKIIQI